MIVCKGSGGLGDDEEHVGGYAHEYLRQIVVALKNFISRDPKGMLKVGQGQSESNLALVFHFVQKCIKISRSNNEYQDRISIISVLIALLENMHGSIDNEIPYLLRIIL